MKTNNKKRLEIANQTLEITKTGCYSVNGIDINILNEISESIENTFTVSPGQFEEIIDKNLANNYTTKTEVINCSTIEAIQLQDKELKTLVLNFASAKNPGGGFLGGASAQEESLARSSSLFAGLSKDMTMYNFNRGRSTFLYSDYMIYSPKVSFWNDDEGNFLAKPISVDVVTSPAPNKGAMLQHNRISELDQIENVFKGRIEKMLYLAKSQKIECLILGAWGCGVFKNNSKDVANYFDEVIRLNFKNDFKKIVYAVFDNSSKKENFLAFKEAIILE